MFHKCTFPLLRASSRAWIWMRSCMWAVTPTTQSSPKLLALRLVLLVRHHSVYTLMGNIGWRKGLLIWYCCHAGCIRQLVIQGEEVIFKDLDRSSTGVTNCPTCKDHPCQVGYIHPLDVFAVSVLCLIPLHPVNFFHVVIQNGGRCEDSEASLYKCSCPRGFTGSNCQHHSSLHCHSGTCESPGESK